MSESGDDALKPSNFSLETFQEKFHALLNIKSLSSRTKAANLIVDNQIIFKDAKIISDIRPIFGDNIEDQPIGAVIVHRLKIVYDENDELKNFHIALDEKDVESLIGHLKRTQTKSKSLKRFINSSGLSSYEIE